MPHYLTASIFSAQSGEIAVFHRNVRLLVLLCVTSGICRSKSCMVKVPFFLKLQIVAWHSFYFFFFWPKEHDYRLYNEQFILFLMALFLTSASYDNTFCPPCMEFELC